MARTAHQRIVGRVWCAAWLLAATAGCPPVPGSTCKSDSDCDQRSICFKAVCRISCNSNQDCTGDETCAQGVCLPPQLAPPRDGGNPVDAARTDASNQDRVRVDTSHQADSTGFDGAMSDRVRADAAPEDALVADGMTCLAAYQDNDDDCQVRSSQVVLCNQGGLPAGWCVEPLLQSQGPRSARVEQNIATASSDDWTNLGNTADSDDAYTVANFGDRTGIAELHLTDFGFAIPAQAIVVGVVAVVERSVDDNSGTVTDGEVRLVRGGTLLGLDHASNAPWTLTDATVSYGHQADTWGVALTGSDVDDPTFGLGITAQLASGGHNTRARIDQVRLTIYFHDDCDDHDPQCSLARYRDADGDGYGVDPLLCVNNERGYSLLSGDCDDASSGTWRHRYRDVDLDGHGAGAQLCVGDASGFAESSDDCDDADNRVHPGQLSYFSAPRSDNSYDFDCDRQSTPQNVCNTSATTTACSTASVTGVVEGWVGTIPVCGQSGTYRGCIVSLSSTCPVADFDGLHACSTRTCSYVYARVADVTTAQACR